MHGAKAPQVARKAVQRVALRELVAQEIGDDERRDPREILVDACQRVDVIMTRAEFEGGVGYPEHVLAVLRAAKLVVDSGTLSQLVAAKQRNLDREASHAVEATIIAVDAMLDALPIPPVQRPAWRAYALGTAVAALHGVPLPNQPPVPAPLAIQHAYTVDPEGAPDEHLAASY